MGSRQSKQIPSPHKNDGQTEDDDQSEDDEQKASQATPMALPNGYKYEGFSEGKTIRVVRLEPGTGPLVCQIIQINHSDTQDSPFTALSYTWEDPHPELTAEANETWESPEGYSIICDNYSVTIQRNLYDFLHQLRQNGWFGPFWVDALCINQRDIDERSAQVAMMGGIYVNAQEVIVWLGKGNESTEEAAKVMPTFVTRLEGVLKELDHLSYGEKPEIYAEGYSLVTRAQMQSIASWYAFSWYRRGWVLQEAALSRKCRVLCGSSEMDFDFVGECARFLDCSGERRFKRAGGNSLCYLGVEGANQVFEVYQQQRRGGVLDPGLALTIGKKTSAAGRLDGRAVTYGYLDDLLHLLHERSFKEKRDVVFAGVALIKTMAMAKPEWVRDLGPPNYRHSVERVWTDVYWWIAEYSARRGILGRGPYGIEVLPHWIGVGDGTWKETENAIERRARRRAQLK